MTATQATHTDAARDARRAQVRRLRQQGRSGRAIARQLGLSEAMVRRDLAARADAADAPAPAHPADAPTQPPAHPVTHLDTLRHIARQLRAIPADALDGTHATHHQARAIAVHAVRLLAAAPPADDAERDVLRHLADALTHIARDAADAPDAESDAP